MSQETVALEGQKPKEAWNNPPGNKWRYLSTLWYFVLMGMNDAAPGVSQSQIYIRAYTDQF